MVYGTFTGHVVGLFSFGILTLICTGLGAWISSSEP